MTRDATPPRQAHIEGIAMWSPALPGWAHAAPALRGEADSAQTRDAQAPLRPTPSGLGANERRRAPDSVLVALQVAEDAAAMAGRAVRDLPSVFTSAHGDLPILDALLRTLADSPQLLSPTRFHHSVHNAPSGYWAIASGSHAASTALAAFDHSFGAGLLEALVQVTADGKPLLVAGCDAEATGPLISVNASRGLLGAALVLSPVPSLAARWSIAWRLVAREPGERAAAAECEGAVQSAAVKALRANALADALPLFEALARGAAATVHLRCGPAADLRLDLQPSARAG